MAGIYIHIPFCRQRCTYCDFYFVTGHRRINDFVRRAQTEIRHTHADFRLETVQTVYFGGGTPSRISAEALAQILAEVTSTFDVAPDAEVTLEANPEDLSAGYLADLRGVGFNRLSIGVQSFDPEHLAFMNRAHTAQEGRSSVEEALRGGFDNVSVDLIFGLPGQSTSDWIDGLESLVALGVPHLSTYGLTVEPQTVLAKRVASGAAAAPNQDAMADTYLATIDMLEEAGYRHYEISSFGRPGMESRHNTSYWNHANYIGFGPAAHSFWWTDPPSRWSNVRSLRRYLEADTDWGELRQTEKLTGRELAHEHVLLKLRTDDGLDLSVLARKFQHRLSRRGSDRVSELVLDGYVTHEDDLVRLSRSGRLLADAIAVSLCDDGLLVPTD